MPPKSINPRFTAVQALARIVDQDQQLDLVLNSLRDFPERAWLQELLYGTLRYYHRLEVLSGLLLKQGLKVRDRDIQLLLILGLYESYYMDTKAHAAVNETVAVTRSLNKNWASGLVNACLRRARREREDLEARLDDDPVAHYSHPEWFIGRLRQQYPTSWEAILEANNQRPPLHLRVNTRLITRDAYMQQLEQAGLPAHPLPHCDQGITLDRPVGVMQLPGFDQGLVSVQDGAAQLAAELLDLAPGQLVLDACAAPGGKACHILEHEAGLAGLILVENSEARAGRIRDNLSRLGLSARLHIDDAGAPDRWWDGQAFQRILLDAPCSATGVIRRHPDIKLHRTPAQIHLAAGMQAKLLDALWPLLDSGGKLLYATCSVLAEENQRPLSRFLAQHDDATEAPLALPWAERCEHGYQILPGTSGLDGFFYGCIQKQ